MSKPQHIRTLIAKAYENLEVCEQLLATRHFGICASRAYYAMFYAAQAALLHKDLQFKRHSAVISAFNKEFVKTGVFPPATFKSLQKGYDLRIEGDYGLLEVSEDEAAAVVREADDFLRIITKYLISQGYQLEEPDK